MQWPNLSTSDWSLILSLIALGISIMTLPTVFQMFWGRPSLEVTLNEHQDMDIKALRCLIGNKPIGNRFLSLIGVIRQPTEILGQLTVSEAGSGKIIAGSIRMYLTTEKEKGKQVALASFRPAILLVAVYKDSGVSLLMDVDEQLDSPHNIKLERGRYKVTCAITYSHNRVLKCTGEFLVGETISDFYWTGVKPKILRKI